MVPSPHKFFTQTIPNQFSLIPYLFIFVETMKIYIENKAFLSRLRAENWLCPRFLKDLVIYVAKYLKLTTVREIIFGCFKQATLRMTLFEKFAYFECDVNNPSKFPLCVILVLTSAILVFCYAGKV